MHTLAITFLALLSLRELHSRKRYYTRVIQRVLPGLRGKISGSNKNLENYDYPRVISNAKVAPVYSIAGE